MQEKVWLKMIKLASTIIFTVIVLISCQAHAIERVPAMVFLRFTDNTPYREMETSYIMDDLLLDRLLSIEAFCIMERSAAEDVLKIEDRLNVTDAGLDKAVAANDFSYIFNASNNDLTVKNEGEFIDSEITGNIGKKHHADYILHGSIDYLGKNSKTIMVPLHSFSFESSTPYLEAVVTIRIIKASTGEVVWVKKEKGVSKDSLVKFRNASWGTGDFYNLLFYEALDKISQKISKALIEDLQSQQLILKIKEEA